MSLKKLAVGAWALACRQLEKRERGAWTGVARGENLDLRSLRVALVKQSTYCDLYADPAATSPYDLLASSWHRTGPIGLFLGCTSRFIIVRAEDAPECRVWEAKLAYEQGAGERGERFPRIRKAQSLVAVAADTVDWAEFGVVIALENAVPAAVTARYPGVLWCTMLEHHRMRPYRAYLAKAPPGYAVFLNLRMGPNPVSLFRKPHVVDFPYGLNRAGGLAEIYQRDAKAACGVMLEDNQDAAVLGPLLSARGIEWTQGGVPGGSLVDYHKKLAGCRILLAPRSARPLGGLAALDAAAMDCLIVGRGADCWNPYLILPDLDIGDPARAVARVAELLADEGEFQRLLTMQRARMAWFGWERPWRQLLAARRKLVVLDCRNKR
jgi:hypothetical protein